MIFHVIFEFTSKKDVNRITNQYLIAWKFRCRSLRASQKDWNDYGKEDDPHSKSMPKFHIEMERKFCLFVLKLLIASIDDGFSNK